MVSMPTTGESIIESTITPGGYHGNCSCFWRISRRVRIGGGCNCVVAIRQMMARAECAPLHYSLCMIERVAPLFWVSLELRETDAFKVKGVQAFEGVTVEDTLDLVY